METLQKIQQFIEKEIKISASSKLIVGVSGGADSVVMLHILRKFGYSCVVAHCNFHLRGEESNRDEKFVENICEENQLPFFKIDFDTTEFAKQNKISIEMAARDLRYAWFEKIRSEQHADFIAVAHHADDSIETFLMNLVRGSGLRGLKGIEGRNGKVIRPLLCCNRTEIEKFAEQHTLDFITDSTNLNTDFLRNKIRLELLPLLADFNPSIKQTFTETIERLSGTWKIFDNYIDKIKNEITFEKNDNLYIEISKLQQQTDVNTVLFEILQPYHFNTDVVKQIAGNLNSTSGLKFISENYLLVKDRDFLILSKKNLTDIEFEISNNDTEIFNPIHLLFYKIARSNEVEISKKTDKIHIDFDLLHFPLTLRKWEKGDFFYPFGMNNKKKVSDFFIDEKVNLIDKQNAWLLLSDDKIVWIVGMRVDNRFRITEKTENILEISFVEKTNK